MEAIISAIIDNPGFARLREAMDSGRLPAYMWGIDKNVMMPLAEAIRSDNKFLLIVTYDESRAEKLYEEYRFYNKNVYLYPAKDALFYYADVHGNATVRKRLEIFKRIYEEKETVVITTIDGLMDKIPALSDIMGDVIEIKKGNTIDVSALKKKLSTFGYDNVPMVEEAGQFCVRGGIIDIYPLTEECPYRIELWVLKILRDFQYILPVNLH